MFNSILVYVVVIGVWHRAASSRTERMTISKMSMSDLESSATGYAYNQVPGQPVSYVRYTNHGRERYYDAPPTSLHYVAAVPSAPVAPSIPEIVPLYGPSVVAYASAGPEIVPYVVQRTDAKGDTGNYGAAELPEYVRPSDVRGKLEPRAPYYEEAAAKPGQRIVTDGGYVNEDGGVNRDNERPDNHEDEESGGSLESDEDHEKEEDHEDPWGGENEDEDEDNFNEGSGRQYAVDEYAESGEKGSKGFASHHEYDNGDHGRYSGANEEGYYDEKSGHDASYDDKAGAYGSHDEAEKSVEGNSHGGASYHKKGTKTTGYHNVYRKDEYKKSSDFYDENHKDGHFDKYGSFNKHQGDEEDHFTKGGNHDTKLSHGNTEKKGYYDKGSLQKHHQGYQSEAGDDSYRQNHADYAKKHDVVATKKYGYIN